MIRILVAGALSFAVTAVLVPVFWRIARPRGWLVARPAADRWHRYDVLKIGGVAMLAGLLPLAFFDVGTELSRVVLLSLLMWVAGFVDDLRPVRPWTKLGAQLAATMIFLLSGPLPHISGVVWIDVVLSLAWIVFLTNAFNLTDNIDGLAAGVTAIAGIFGIAVLAGVAESDGGLAIGLAAVAGAAAAFVLYNWSPASAFMGDSGSHLLGSFIAGATLLSMSASARPIAYLSALTLLLVVPVADTLLVIVTRTVAGVSPFTGGRDHISHRLVALEMTEGRAVMALYGYAIGGGLAALSLQYLPPALGWTAAAVFAAGTATAAINIGRIRIERLAPAPTSEMSDTSARVLSGETSAASSPAHAAHANPAL